MVLEPCCLREGMLGAMIKPSRPMANKTSPLYTFPRRSWSGHLNHKYKELVRVDRGEFRLLLQVLQMVVIPSYEESSGWTQGLEDVESS